MYALMLVVNILLAQGRLPVVQQQ